MSNIVPSLMFMRWWNKASLEERKKAVNQSKKFSFAFGVLLFVVAAVLLSTVSELGQKIGAVAFLIIGILFLLIPTLSKN